MPAWAISKIEKSLYDFFWNYKSHLTTKNILTLLLKEGGFNIPRLGTKILSLRLNTLRRLLSEEKAHWKYFTSYFLRTSNVHLGKMSLTLDYSLQRIDRDIPSFHKELLTTWHRHKDHQVQTRSPESVTDILNEPLFLNPLIMTDDKPLIFTDWIAAGFTRIRDICYEVIPGYLPVSATHDMLTDSKPHTLAKKIRRTKRAIFRLSPTEKYLFSFDLWSQVLLRGVSTWLGDHLHKKTLHKRVALACTSLIVQGSKRFHLPNKLAAHQSCLLFDCSATPQTTSLGVIFWVWLWWLTSIEFPYCDLKA